MAKIVNTVTVRTTEGPQVVTKTSTHRTYVLASIVEFADGTQVVLSWHLTKEAAARYAQSAEAARMAVYAASKRGDGPAHVGLLPVTVQAKAPKAAAPVQDSPAIVLVQSGTTGNTCRCGCGQAIGSKSQYRPGHDARHASIVGHDIASSSQQYFERTTADSDLGSEALVRKAYAIAEKLLAKAAKKA